MKCKKPTKKKEMFRKNIKPNNVVVVVIDDGDAGRKK